LDSFAVFLSFSCW